MSEELKRIETWIVTYGQVWTGQIQATFLHAPSTDDILYAFSDGGKDVIPDIARAKIIQGEFKVTRGEVWG